MHGQRRRGRLTSLSGGAFHTAESIDNPPAKLLALPSE
ncbi:hypothetical protein BOO71_0007183 [Deinococcus marmoris]|uniref:Uncharacterized protein n=1 Tax=Deinococcus marmoris TaxID=249408 RepID=A0A1U7NYQ0_9DEIO|nr:hypothetical protein BOO71_0007183 [Deinococcus marmoris]